MDLKLNTEIRYVPGVGPVKAKLFTKLGVYTMEDLLNYFPYDWMFGPTDADVQQRLAEVIKHKNERIKDGSR